MAGPEEAGESGNPATLSLLVESPSGEKTEVPVDRDPFLLGRLADCHLTLRDRRISRRHARIGLRRGVLVLEDLGSRHGLQLNGERIRARPLQVGDRIEFGVPRSFRITVRDGFRPKAGLLKRVADLAPTRSRTGALGHLAAILEVARTVESSDGVDEVFQAVVQAALAITGGERAFLLIRDAAGELQVRAGCDSTGSRTTEADLETPLPAIEERLATRKDFLTASISRPGDTGDGVVPQDALCVPVLRMRIGRDHETSVLAGWDETLGALYVHTAASRPGLGEDDQALLQALAIEISTVLENARLLEEERGKRRLERELELARGIQRALLPRALPTAGWLTASGHCEARGPLGGDYFDLMQQASGKWTAVVADVSGKGVSASLLASLLQGAFFLGSDSEVSLAGTLDRINRYLCERSRQPRFATVFALVLDQDGTMLWSNAGHCPAIVVRAAGGLEWLRSNCRPVGLFEDTAFSEDSCRLCPGDKLVVYTDGATELRDAGGEEFGERRLGATVGEHADLSARDLFDVLVDGFEGFAGSGPRTDDLTLLVLGFREGVSRPTGPTEVAGPAEIGIESTLLELDGQANGH